MMSRSKGSDVSPRQAGIFIFFAFTVSKFVNLPSLLHQSYNDVAIVLFFTLVVLDLSVFLIALNFAKRHAGISFYDYMTQKFGKVVAKTVLMAICVYYIIRFSAFIAGNFQFLRDSIFSQATLYFYLTIIVVAIAPLVICPIRTFARTCEFYFIIVFAGFALCVLLGFFSGGFEFPFVSFDISAANFFDGVIKNNWFFGDSIIVLLFMENFKKDENFIKKTSIYCVLATISLIVFAICFYGVFPVTAFDHSYAIYEMSIFAPRISSIGRLDVIPVLTMMFFVILQGAILCRCVTKSMEDFAEASHHENKGSLIISLLIFVVLVYFVFYSDELVFEFVSGPFRWFSFAVCFVLPLLLVLDFLTKRRSNDTRN